MSTPSDHAAVDLYQFEDWPVRVIMRDGEP